MAEQAATYSASGLSQHSLMALFGDNEKGMGRRHRAVVEALRGVLPEDEISLAVKSFDLVGDVAVIKIHKSLEMNRFLIANALRNHLPHVKTVLRQVGAVEGNFRTRRLEWLCGDRKTVTSHREHGCIFEVDLAKTYFSPRLLHERARISDLCRNSGKYEDILNMFSGVGCFSISIAKQPGKRHVYSVDLNPNAIKCQLTNIRSNQVRGIVTAILGESKQIIESLFQKRLQRILMPLPEKSYLYLESAAAAIGEEGGTIHYYDFTHAHKNENPIQKVIEKVTPKLKAQPRHFSIEYGRVVRSTGPNWYQIALDITLK